MFATVRTITLLVLVSTVGAARGAPIRLDFSGSIRSVGAAPGVAPGDRFSGSISYDPEWARPNGSVYGSRGYSLGSAAVWTLQVAGQPASTFTDGLRVLVGQTPEPGSSRPETPQSSIVFDGLVGLNRVTPFLQLRNPRRTVLPSLAVPTALSLADFPDANLLLYTNPGGVTLWQGTVDSLTVVPEPAATTCLCLAASGWLALVRRARRQVRPAHS